jgi:GT2 family glycosyltransferase
VDGVDPIGHVERASSLNGGRLFGNAAADGEATTASHGAAGVDRRSASTEGVARPRLPARRPYVRGKFIFVGATKLRICGVTYGTFRPDEHGSEFSREQVEADFSAMAVAGINAVRLYKPPPRWLLDAAAEHGIYVMVGLDWAQHVAFLDDDRQAQTSVERVRAGVARCAGHPAVLCYAVGNEIPAGIVRWHGRQRVERFLARLCAVVQEEDPGALVTYVNYPSTEYLDVPQADFVCFNVYLESRRKLESYIARLQNLADERPLVLAEIGLDSQRNGEDKQARVLRWQVETALASGCAGAFVFSWTDEWHCGGFDVEDWDFGLTDRDRCPKPALAAVREAFANGPAVADTEWPSASVVVCTHNGGRTLGDCLEGLASLDYPSYEVIVVDDGSTDASREIAEAWGVRVISTENQGLSAARNTGFRAASGEIVAYIDDDARADPDWLRFIALDLISTEHMGVGGPNLAPADDGRVADCVANAPGGPVHVLLSDRVAEHIPGCNMAFWRDALQAIDGFDTRFRTAGDDVDLCWRLQQRGQTIGFAPAAIVWHHRRNSLRAYWRQQRGYGKAEAMLERKWPEKYNRLGHLRWSGRMYGKGAGSRLRLRRGRVHHGTWGTGLFQSLYEPPEGSALSLALVPELYILLAVLLGIGAVGLVWRGLLVALPLAGLAGAILVARAIAGAAGASFTSDTARRRDAVRLYGITTALHLLQPVARLLGRFGQGLTPWRHRAPRHASLPYPATHRLWGEAWASVEQRLQALEGTLRARGTTVRRGGEFDRWDLEVQVGLMGCSRARMVMEEHGAGRQLVRLRRWPRCALHGTVALLSLAMLACAAALDSAPIPAALLAAACGAIGLRAAWEAAGANVGVDRAVKEWAPASGLAELHAAGERAASGTRDARTPLDEHA